MKRETLLRFFLFMGTCSLSLANKEASLAVRQGNGLFSTQLYDAVRKDHKDNLVVSPVSVSAVLAMLQAGARGNTARDIRSTFHFPADDQLNPGYQSFMQQLRNDDNITLEMVNRIYPSNGYALNPQFSATLKNYFGAEPQPLNYFRNVEAAEQINSFVSQSTHGKIPTLIQADALSENTKLVLINAIYFKGNWKQPFQKYLTSKKDFYTSETTSVQVDMMNQVTEMFYAELPELDAKAVALSYEGDSWRMIVILPNKRTGLAEMEDKLKSISLDKIIESMKYKTVVLYLPKYKVESTINLQQPLTNLGAGVIFNPQRADLSGISASTIAEKLYVSKVLQKAFIEVNEEGSEAAAATVVSVASYSAVVGQTNPTPVVNVDHPFYSVIVHQEINDNKVQTTPVFVQRIVKF